MVRHIESSSPDLGFANGRAGTCRRLLFQQVRRWSAFFPSRSRASPSVPRSPPRGCAGVAPRRNPTRPRSMPCAASSTALPIDGTVVIGEGEMDEAPMLFIGEKVGTKAGPKVDIAVDPLEGTTLCAKNMPGAIATIAMAERRRHAARPRHLYGQDRHRPRLSEERGRSRRAGRREHSGAGQGQGRKA